MAKIAQESLLEHERFELKAKSGGGLLSYEVWGYRQRGQVIVTRCNLAWIKHAVFAGDNGRVLGFDNAHGYHHRHCMGKVEPVQFVSFEATQERFQREWLAMAQTKKGKKHDQNRNPDR